MRKIISKKFSAKKPIKKCNFSRSVITVTSSNDYDFLDLMNNSWSGALDTLKDIEEADKEDELMDLLAMYSREGDGVWDQTELNDFLWFERDTIYPELGLDSNGKLIEEEDDEEEDFSRGKKSIIKKRLIRK